MRLNDDVLSRVLEALGGKPERVQELRLNGVVLVLILEASGGQLSEYNR